MCGRTSLAVSQKQLENRFNAKLEADFNPIYNGAPAQKLPIIRNISPRKIELVRWGFLPQWLKDERPAGFINAKAETIFEKPTFKKAILEKRCLVPADGFYEWSQNADKIPFRITLKDQSIYSYAGIWASFLEDKNEVTTFSILTIASNGLIKLVHDRMPVILEKDLESVWLGTKSSQRQIDLMLRPYPSDKMTMYRVSSLVNSPRNNTAEVIQPLNQLI